MPYEVVEEDVSTLLEEFDAAGLITWSELTPAGPADTAENR
jgi:hypothetical protein